jgi:hypothetical protein
MILFFLLVAALIMVAFWRQLILLVLCLFLVVFGLGLIHVAQMLHH